MSKAYLVRLFMTQSKESSSKELRLKSLVF
jgi:hypothetical protein